jgi:hypothetical protein
LFTESDRDKVSVHIFVVLDDFQHNLARQTTLTTNMGEYQQAVA